MAVTMAMTVESVWETAEAAIGGGPAGLDRRPDGIADHFPHGAGSAVAPSDKAHRHSSDCGASHDCQDHTARAFHEFWRALLKDGARSLRHGGEGGARRSSAAGKMRSKGSAETAEAAARRLRRTGRRRRSRGGGIAAIETAARPPTAEAAAAASTSTGDPFWCGWCHDRRAGWDAVLLGHQRVCAAANRQRAHHEQSDVVRTFDGLCAWRDDRLSLAELGSWRPIHLGR